MQRRNVWWRTNTAQPTTLSTRRSSRRAQPRTHTYTACSCGNLNPVTFINRSLGDQWLSRLWEWCMCGDCGICWHGGSIFTHWLICLIMGTHIAYDVAKLIHKSLHCICLWLEYMHWLPYVLAFRNSWPITSHTRMKRKRWHGRSLS